MLILLPVAWLVVLEVVQGVQRATTHAGAADQA
jgi:hypothetical protein